MMNRLKRIGLIAASCLCVSASVATVTENTVIVAEAHSGRTDAHGGHRDNKNKSGLGSYHYHCGGHPAHLHPNGVCPYSNSSAAAASSANQTAAQSNTVSANRPASANSTENTAADVQTVTQEMMENYSAVFDAAYYYNHYEDLQNAVGNDSLKLFQHFLNSGMQEGRQGCESFNVSVYRQNNPDLEEAFGDDLPQYYHHYMNNGCHEGRICH